MRRAYWLLALAQLAIGAAAIFARLGLTGAGPVAVAALRLTFAAVPVAALAAQRGAFRVYAARTEWRLFGAGIALALHFALWIASLRITSVALSTLLVCTAPVWTEGFAIVRTRRIRPAVAAGIGCAFAGVFIVIGTPARTETPLGIALALGGGLAIAIYLVLVRGCDARYGTLAVIGRTYSVAALVLLAAAALLHDPFPAAGDSRAWAGILAMACLSQLFGHTALNAALRRLSATFVATVTLIEPAIAALLAALIFGERLAPPTLAGAAVILVGIAIAMRSHGSTRQPVTAD